MFQPITHNMLDNESFAAFAISVNNFEINESYPNYKPFVKDSLIFAEQFKKGDSYADLLPQFVCYILVAGMILALLSGTFFKLVLYKGLSRHKIADRPINLAILVNAVIHQATHTFCGIDIILMLGFGINGGDLYGDLYCYAMLIVGSFGLVYLSVGSFLTAVYRVLFIKGSSRIRTLLRDRRMIVLVLLGGLLATTFVTVTLYHYSPRLPSGLVICLGESHQRQLVYSEYQISSGKIIILKSKPLMPTSGNIKICRN